MKNKNKIDYFLVMFYFHFYKNFFLVFGNEVNWKSFWC